MSATYFFHEPGSVPGIPGLFSGCRVDVAEDGTFTVSPLPYHPHAELAKVQETPPKSKRQAKAVPIEEGA